MQFTYSPYILPLLFAVVVTVIVAFYVWGRRAVPSAIALALMAIAIAEWSLGYALEIASIGLPAKIFWAKLQYIGIVAIPVCWLIFAYKHAKYTNRISLPKILALSVIPLVTLAVVATNEQHGLIWSAMAISQTPGFPALDLSHGWWFWVINIYSHVLLLSGAIIILRVIGKMEGIYRRQTIILVIGLLAPWVGNIIYVLGLSPVPGMDFTPFAFTITVVAMAWGVFGFHFADIYPIARDQVVDGMRDGMIVLDIHDRIADMNPAAGLMIGIPAGQAIGKAIN